MRPEVLDVNECTSLPRAHAVSDDGGGGWMADEKKQITRDDLIKALNDDLSREYQAIIAYVVYSQSLKGAEYMNIKGELEKHAKEELQHALTIAKHIDYLGGEITATPKSVKTSDKQTEMLRFDLDNENETVRHYRQRVRQCETLGEYGIGEDIREILRQEQEHQNDLADALGIDVPNAAR
jgi:bacterioferritin